MRHSSARRDPRHTRSAVLAGVAVLLACLTFGFISCSRQPDAVPAAPAPTTSAAPTTTTATTPATTTTPAPTLATVAAPPTSAAPERSHLARSSPVRLQVAAIGVDTTLMTLGLRTDGTMEVPPGGFPAGWYTGGPTPGELGPAVITGHVDMKGPGVFYRLHQVKPGDTIMVTRKDGTKPVFRVTRISLFAKDKFPTAQVYGNVRRPVLRLITCGGSFDSRSGHYEGNLVAFADLVPPAR